MAKEFDKAWSDRLLFLHDWIRDTFEPGTIREVKWQDDRHATAWDEAGDKLELSFQGHALLADGRPVARMP